MSERLTDWEVKAFFDSGTQSERLLADEILERRARDLTWDESDTLKSLGERYIELRGGIREHLFSWEKRALAALDKLLGGNRDAG